MTPLPDRTVLLGLLTTLGLVFALVFWSVRLTPPLEPPLQWRQQPSPVPTERPGPQRAAGALI